MISDINDFEPTEIGRAKVAVWMDDKHFLNCIKSLRKMARKVAVKSYPALKALGSKKLVDDLYKTINGLIDTVEKRRAISARTGNFIVWICHEEPNEETYDGDCGIKLDLGASAHYLEYSIAPGEILYNIGEYEHESFDTNS